MKGALRAVRKLVLGETWVLPGGVAVVVALAGATRLVVGPHGWFRDVGGVLLALGVLAVLALSVRPPRA